VKFMLSQHSGLSRIQKSCWQ